MTTSSSAVLLLRILLPLLLLSACLQDVRGEDGDDDSSKKKLPSTCTPEFQKMKGSTMCLFDNINVTKSGVSDADKKTIVDLHNKLRGHVSPSAANMRKLMWDDKFAEVAQKWAMQCIIGHDKNRKVPSYAMGIGQNAAAGYGDWEGAVMGWYNEVKLFKYGEDANVYLGKNGWKKIGHYTQVVQANTQLIGCGFSRCKGTSFPTYYICNYGPGQYDTTKPYANGTSCAQCPRTCKNNLCDCNGKVCRNGGKLDINSCTCTCNKLYTGDTCETLVCPAKDGPNCWISYKQKDCGIYSNVPIACPFMCGICGGPNGATPPPAVTSKFGCTYSAPRPSAAECAKFGDKGADTWACASTGGNYGCKSCIAYSNVKTQYCPVMCGYCDGPCDGLTCMYGGKLNRDTCKCECKHPYTGDQCEKVACTKPESSSCWIYWKPSQCKYSNVKRECFKMCGLCGKDAVKPPPTYTSKQGCKYQGNRPSKEECMKYGNKGKDWYVCASKGGGWKCDACKKWSNVPTDYCPIMCGLCAP